MPVFEYKAMTKSGQIVRNKVDEQNKQELLKRLKENDLMPINIVQQKVRKHSKKKRKNVSEMNNILKSIDTTKLTKRGKTEGNFLHKLNLIVKSQQKVTSRDIVIFTQNLYLLKKANFNNIHALTTIIQSTENLYLRDVLYDILAGLEAGDYMYQTMEYYSDVFPYIYINMIKVGELSGSLTNSLQQAVRYLDESTSMNKKIKGILIPNIAQFILLFVMLIAGTVVAIPAIQGVFDEVGSDAELPPVTVWFSGVVDNLILYWYIPVIFIAAVVGVIVLYVNTPKGKYNFHYFKYTMPIFGGLIYAIDFSRFIRAVLLNLENGMRIQDALEVAKNVVKNLVMMSMIEAAINNILIGQSWIEPFEKAGLSSAMTTEMLKIGMQTDLTEMMHKLLEYMDLDIDNLVTKVMKALPQIVYAIVGVILIFFVLVVLVPVIQVYMGTFLFSAYDV